MIVKGRSWMQDIKSFEYDVALSFAGEDREYVEKVASLLKENGIKVFYDDFEKATLWGKDLYTYLAGIYQDKAQYTVMFISEHYAKKQWTNHEKTSAQARAFSENKEYILPARFDDTQIPGVPQTVGYISLVDTQPENFVDLIQEKLTHTKTNRNNAMKAAAFAQAIKNPELISAILKGDDESAVKQLGKDSDLEKLFFNMFESGALD
jgi:hypothetical protein